jgi:glycosyltransferase involved in cell wall biosynthesis
MACGLPVVATDVPGTREVIDHRETGFLCGSSAAELRQAIVEVLDNQALRTKMGAKAALYVQKNASLERVLELEIGLFEAMELEN